MTWRLWNKGDPRVQWNSGFQTRKHLRYVMKHAVSIDLFWERMDRRTYGTRTTCQLLGPWPWLALCRKERQCLSREGVKSRATRIMLISLLVTQHVQRDAIFRTGWQNPHAKHLHFVLRRWKSQMPGRLREYFSRKIAFPKTSLIIDINTWKWKRYQSIHLYCKLAPLHANGQELVVWGKVLLLYLHWIRYHHDLLKIESFGAKGNIAFRVWLRAVIS